MLTKEQILSAVKAGRKSECLDSRDYSRLSAFFDESELSLFGFTMKEGAIFESKEYNEDNVLKQIEADVDFGFEKALDMRGISASMMHSVVKMWMWVMEDDLQYHDEYAQYGLPLFKAVAEKYGFNNPIGNDEGNEEKYASY